MPGAEAAFVPGAVQERFQLHFAADVQRADAFRRIELVRRLRVNQRPTAGR